MAYNNRKRGQNEIGSQALENSINRKMGSSELTQISAVDTDRILNSGLLKDKSI